MNIRALTISIVIILSAIFVTSCTKEGPVGPQGPMGNANVISSPWYTPVAWAGQSGDWYFQVNNTAITSDIVENGAILAYASLPNDLYPAAVRQLPAYALGCNWDFLIPDYGTIEFASDAISQPGTTGYSFRFILIPADTYLKSTKLKSKSITELRNMSYPDVCKLLGIQE